MFEPITFDVLMKEMLAETPEEEYLSRRCSERGIYRYPASKALLKGEFSIADIPIGSRFSLDAYNYRAVEKLDNGNYKMECETQGSEGKEITTLGI